MIGYKIRMHNELRWLGARLNKLDMFLGTEKYCSLAFKQKFLLKLQYYVMRLYLSILYERLR